MSRCCLMLFDDDNERMTFLQNDPYPLLLLFFVFVLQSVWRDAVRIEDNRMLSILVR